MGSGIIQFIKQEPRVETPAERFWWKRSYMRRHRLPLSRAWNERLLWWIPVDERIKPYAMPPPARSKRSD